MISKTSIETCETSKSNKTIKDGAELPRLHKKQLSGLNSFLSLQDDIDEIDVNNFYHDGLEIRTICLLTV